MEQETVRGPRVLFASGKDSSRRAGADADLEAAQAAGCAPKMIITALTDQDLFQVRSVEERMLWSREADDALKAAAEGRAPAFGAVKFGLLAGPASIVEAARLVARCRHGATAVPAVVDPVIASSSGYRFWKDRELACVRDSLMVAGPILTPNLPELGVLGWEDPDDLMASDERRVRAAARLFDAGVSAVVVKGGHGRSDAPVRDLVLEPGADPVWIERPREEGKGIRGSGCRFASALACALARGETLAGAAEAAGEYVAARIRDARDEAGAPA